MQNTIETHRSSTTYNELILQENLTESKTDRPTAEKIARIANIIMERKGYPRGTFWTIFDKETQLGKKLVFIDFTKNEPQFEFALEEEITLTLQAALELWETNPNIKINETLVNNLTPETEILFNKYKAAKKTKKEKVEETTEVEPAPTPEPVITGPLNQTEMSFISAEEK
jgi:hypothetical protein